MKRLEDLLNLDLPLPARLLSPALPSFLGDGASDTDVGDEDEPVEEADDENDEADESEKPGTIHFGQADEPAEEEAENLGDDFFGEGAGATRATGRKKFDEDEEGTEDENLDLDELDDDSEEEGDSADEGDADVDDDDDEFDDDDDVDDDDDDDFDDDE